MIVRIDRGVAGRGITDVEAVEIDNSLYLVFSFTDGTTETVGPVGTIQYIGQAPIVVNGSTISLSTVPVNLGGTGATTAANARTNLNAANQDTTITAGTGLSGGGSLAANRTLSIANTAVTAAAYGSASKTLTATVNAQGQLTALADTNIAIANTQISGLGTMSTQNATSVAITGGSITGITDLAVADGGTGASDASGARTNLGAAASAITISAGTGLSGGGDLSANRTLSIANTAVTAAAYGSASNTLTATVNAQGQLTALAATPIAIANTQVSGLGTMSTQNANSVTITGGTITGITDLAIADGGTGASNAADARTNLGLGTAAVLNAGVALGVATLDAGGTVPLSQIPASIQGGVSYQGSWNAATNTPTLTSSVGSKGYYYVVSVAGSTNLNGITDWLPGDWAIFNGSVWEQIDNTDTVASVNGYVGAVVLTAADVGAPPTTRTISAGTGLTGGGDLSANRTITLADTTVTAGAYGSASSVPNYTVNAQGQLTAAASTAIAINGNQITSGTVAIANGGSGTNTAQGAMNAFAGAVTSGSYLRGNGTNVVMSSIQAADVPTLNQNTTGTAANVTGIVGTANGGTGLSSFTANGVVYASSTSVLATGSALTFDGTNLGVGFTANSRGGVVMTTSNNSGASEQGGYQVTNGNGTGLFSGVNGASYSTGGIGNANNAVLYSIGNTDLVFGRNTSEKLRLTATSLYTASGVDVGIGTSSPSSYPVAPNLVVASSGGGGMTVRTNSTYGGVYFADGVTGDEQYRGYVQYNHNLNSLTDAMLFGTAGTGKMTLDSAGNLGLGVTPSAWGSAYKALQVGYAALSNPTATYDALNLTANLWHDGTNWRFIETQQANRFSTLDGNWTWEYATGSSGAIAGLSTQMTLDASGRLLLGTTTGGTFKLDVQDVGNTLARIGGSGSGQAGVTLASGGAFNPFLNFVSSSSTVEASIYAVAGAGAFVIGTGSSSTERMRIDSSGNLFIGQIARAEQNLDSFDLDVQSKAMYINHSNGTTTGTGYLYFGYNAVNIGSITQTGTTAVLFNTTSDQRLKENIQDADSASSLIDSLQVRQFDWKSDNSHQRYGFVAQELVTVAPEAVHQPADPEQMMAVDYSKLVPMLVKEIQALRARVAALEAA